MAAKKQTFAEAPRQHIDCGFVGCGVSATIRTRTKTGWMNVCPEHDRVLVQKSADAYCKARGLDTTEKKRAFVLATVRGMKAKFTPQYQDEREEESIPF